MLEEIWLYPPLAFARVGSAEQPLDNYTWGPNDNAPRGTGKTTVVPAETLDIDASGVIRARLPEEVAFKQVLSDGTEIFHPVCPWFELHGRWDDGSGPVEGPVTSAVLAACGLSLSDLIWTVVVANRKAYNMTLSQGDIITAKVSIIGTETAPQTVNGVSYPGAHGEKPLVPTGTSIPLGRVQLAYPSMQ